MKRCGQLRNILDSDKIGISLKLRLYEASVCSLLTFGCETWTLNNQIVGLINGANSRMLSRFTGKSIPTETRPATCSLNLIHKIRQRRLRWVGHILRQGPGHITYPPNHITTWKVTYSWTHHLTTIWMISFI